MKNSKIKLGLGISLMVLIYLGYGFKDQSLSNNTYQKIEKQVANNNNNITGEELFLKNCSACHGVDRQGNPPIFPSLAHVNQKMTKVEIGTLLTTGRNVMPNFSHLSEPERDAIVGFLYGESTESAVTTTLAPVERGKNLFVANCARCHQPDATNTATQGQMQMGMRPPVLNGVNKRVNIYQFKQILNMGPCYMPSFASMDDTNKEDIYGYLSSLESVNQNSNYRMRRGCGMMMHQ